MNLNDKYFHSVHSYISDYENFEKNIDIRLLKLRRILESGSIMCKSKIIKKYGNEYFHPKKV